MPSTGKLLLRVKPADSRQIKLRHGLQRLEQSPPALTLALGECRKVRGRPKVLHIAFLFASAHAFKRKERQQWIAPTIVLSSQLCRDSA